MPTWLPNIWGTEGFLPHGLCLSWDPGLIQLHVISDVLIALSYYSIPAALGYFVAKRPDLPFQRVFALFVVFILACGTTHVLAAVTLWDPVYRLDGIVKAITAAASVPTAVALWFLMPTALALPSNEQLERANRSMVHEIAERKKAEQEIREMNSLLDQRVQGRTAQLQSILDTVPDAMIVVDGGGIIESFSVAAERLFGYRAGQMYGHTVSLLIPDLQLDGVADFLDHLAGTDEAGGQTRREAAARRSDGTSFRMELSIGRVRQGGRGLYTCFVHDLTERHAAEHRVRGLQAELAHVSRLTEMGQVAAGFAHELNQPLSATANYLGAVRRLLERGDTTALEGAKGATERAIAQAGRAGDIIRRLREFVKKSEPERKPENVLGLIEEASTLALIGSKDRSVTVDWRTAADLPPVLVDKVQIQQVMVNILRNATEAMESSPRRAITIEAAPAEEGLVAIAVADTGHGISQQVAAQLFEPFITTKPHGMGVGLSLCRSIIEAHGGRLWAEANPEGGAVFRFTVPAAAEAFSV